MDSHEGPLFTAPIEFLPDTEEERDAAFHAENIAHVHIGDKVYRCLTAVVDVPEKSQGRPE